MKRKLMGIIIVFLIIFSGLIISCKKAGDNKIHLRFIFWGDVQEIKIINDTIARFEKAYPHIKVHAERAPSGPPYMEKILTQIAGGSAPDVIFVSSDNVVTFVIKKILLPLNKFIKKDKFPINEYYQHKNHHYLKHKGQTNSSLQPIQIV